MITKVFLTIACIFFMCAFISAGLVLFDDERREDMWGKILVITSLLGIVITIGGVILTIVWMK